MISLTKIIQRGNFYSSTARSSFSRLARDFDLTNDQRKAIDIMISGKNLFWQGQVGSGKTLATTLALMKKATQGEKSIILAPTKEICLHIYKQLRLLDESNKIKINRLGSLTWVAPVVSLLSDEQAKNQANYQNMLKKMGLANAEKSIQNDSTDILIITPSLLARTINNLSQQFKPNNIVIDEYDIIQSESSKILKSLFTQFPQSQKVFVCGQMNRQKNTDSDNFVTIASQTPIFKKNFQFTKIICQFDQVVSKKQLLLNLLNKEKQQQLIVFVNFIDVGRELKNYLTCNDVECNVLHSDWSTEERIRILYRYNAKEFRVLISTDIGSRAFDFPHVNHIIQFDFPTNIVSFFQQLGRVNRINKQFCQVTSFIEYPDKVLLKTIEETIKQNQDND